MSTRAAGENLPPEVVEAFVSSAVTALHELTQLIAIPTGRSESQTILPDDPVVVVVRLQRSVPGTMELVLPPQTARRISEAYLPAGAQLSDDIINDVACELANVIAGQAKTILKGTPYHFTLSIPVVSSCARPGESSGAAIHFALETGLLLLLVDLTPCPGA